MQDCETINLNEYTPSGEGGTAITYKHNSRNSLAKLYNSGFEADVAIEEFKVAQAVYDLGIPTPKPYRLVTDGKRLGAEYEFITGKRSFARILSQEPEKMQDIAEAFAKPPTRSILPRRIRQDCPPSGKCCARSILAATP